MEALSRLGCGCFHWRKVTPVRRAATARHACRPAGPWILLADGGAVERASSSSSPVTDYVVHSTTTVCLTEGVLPAFPSLLPYLTIHGHDCGKHPYLNLAPLRFLPPASFHLTRFLPVP